MVVRVRVRVHSIRDNAYSTIRVRVWWGGKVVRVKVRIRMRIRVRVKVRVSSPADISHGHEAWIIFLRSLMPKVILTG